MDIRDLCIAAETTALVFVSCWHPVEAPQVHFYALVSLHDT